MARWANQLHPSIATKITAVATQRGTAPLRGSRTIKAAATVADADFRGLHSFAAIAGKRLRAGIVLYAGRETLPFGDRMWAVPLEALWAENR